MLDAPAAVRPVVVIPVYKDTLTAAETTSIERAVQTLQRHDVCFIGPRRLQSRLPRWRLHDGRTLRFVAFDDAYFSGIKGYNALMRSRNFYATFSDYSHILIAQTDTLVLRDELEAW
jgi:hypothetical protein